MQKKILLLFLSVFFLSACIVTTSPEYTARDKYFILEEDKDLKRFIDIEHDYYSGIVLLYHTDKNNMLNIKVFDIYNNYCIFEQEYDLEKTDSKYKTLKVLFSDIQNNSKNKKYKILLTSTRPIKIFGGDNGIYYRTIYRVNLINVFIAFLKKLYADKPFFVFYILILSVTVIAILKKEK